MNIVVCIKQVPESKEVKINPKNGKIVREGVTNVINAQDKNALEEALRLRELHGGKISVISMGPPQADSALREALALGADEAYLLCDRAFGGADTIATSYVLACGIRKLGAFDLILCGTETIDGCTAQVGPMIAELLGIPHVMYVHKVQPGSGAVQVERTIDGADEELKARLPALLTAVPQLNSVRFTSLTGVLDAYNEGHVTVWSAADIDLDPAKAGAAGSCTQTRSLNKVKNTRPPVHMLSGSVGEMADALAAQLEKSNLL